MVDTFGISQPVRRRGDIRFVAGRGCFADDISVLGQFYSYFVRSKYAHGILRAVNCERARKTPGVLDLQVTICMRPASGRSSSCRFLDFQWIRQSKRRAERMWRGLVSRGEEPPLFSIWIIKTEDLAFSVWIRKPNPSLVASGNIDRDVAAIIELEAEASGMRRSRRTLPLLGAFEGRIEFDQKPSKFECGLRRCLGMGQALRQHVCGRIIGSTSTRCNC
jgi:hypothetical protein